MTRRKTVRYDMCINTLNTSGASIVISKKEFERQIKYYKELVADNHSYLKEEIEEYEAGNRCPSGMEGYIEMDVKTKEEEKYTLTIYMISDDDCWIVFRKIACKPGYCFNRRAERNPPPLS